ncbi:MerR family transcriptional regulator [Bacillus massiliglaciei]|uniref:MerR family transcriptional regulator n=1 Tax=Bacillus massiliglaciei TaxID=1816693 RepID=UPI000AE48065|nr:MerR family transcriptional regulator [Bacillus massiliglaciei]
MNTSAAAKLLGVSHSTVQRWVTQLEMEVGRNQQGHYQFSEEDISLLKDIKKQLDDGVILQKIVLDDKSKKRPAPKPSVQNETLDKMVEKMDRLERTIETKADDVVSYQLIQYRSEMEEALAAIGNLNRRIEELESRLAEQETGTPSDYLLAMEETAAAKKQKKKHPFRSLFGGVKKTPLQS